MNEATPVPTNIALTGKQKSLIALNNYNHRRKGRREVDQSSWDHRCTRILGYMSQGLTVTDIAFKLHLSRATIYNIAKSPYFKSKLEAITTKAVEKVVEKQVESVAEATLLNGARQVLIDAAHDAADKIAVLAKRGKPEERIQLDACRDILDRVNIKGKDVIVTETRNYSPEEIESAKKTLLEVEHITARVTTSQSRFVLPNPSNQPTQAQDAEPSIQASPARQETVPE